MDRLLPVWNLPAGAIARPFGQGHINDTYRVEVAGKSYILQRVNGRVFDLENLRTNYERMVPALQEYEARRDVKLSPSILPTRFNRFHHVDEGQNTWRLVKFQQGSRTHSISPDPETSYRAARTVGAFQLFLNRFSPAQFKETIPGFHALNRRLEKFRETLLTGDPARIDQAKPEVEQVLSLAHLGPQLSQAIFLLPHRVVHGDAKLENVLFVGEENRIIDLDTVMPGFTPFDFGDLVRTCCSPVPEDDPDTEKVKLRRDHFQALARGYLEAQKPELTLREKENLVAGALYIVFEQAVRFLSDYLIGDLYYPVSYDNHNRVRARNQLALLEEILGSQSDLQALMAEPDATA